MKYSRLLPFVCAFLALSAFAQSRNEIFPVKVNDLNYSVPDRPSNAGTVIGTIFETLAGESSNSQNPQLAPAVSAAVRSAFTEVRRLAPVTADSTAVFDLSGDITSIVTHTSTRTVERTGLNGRKYNEVVTSYEASIGVTLMLTEVATGQQWTNSFSANTVWYEDPRNEAAAFELAADKLRHEIVNAYNGMFPLVAQIVEPGSTNRDRQRDIYIDLGEINGVHKGMHFEVYELQSIAGRETRKKIGKLKVEETLGDDISRCKVEKGAREIKAALDDNKTLLVTSID